MGAQSQSPSLTLFFIVEPPSYQYLACYLAASIRAHLPPDVQMVGYCPSERQAELDPAAVETLRRMNCPVRFFATEGRFDTPYPHGNKILACLEPRDTEFSGFVDSDVLMIRDNRVEALVAAGHVSASAAASLRWADQSLWSRLYGAFGLSLPAERIRLMRDKRQEVIPYYSSGFVLFPERHRTDTGQSFPEIWYETARRIDAMDDLPHRRPYLDQMSLPIAITRAGLRWNELPEAQHYILGGSIRGKPLPDEPPIYTVHYRKWDVLKEAGLSELGYDTLRQQVGTSRVKWIFRQPLPPGISKAAAAPDASGAAAPATAETAPATVQPAPAPAAPRRQSPDPSRARLACVTMVRGDHVFLQRWVDYYAPLAGLENLHVLRHGEDAGIDRIAAGTNIVPLPRGDDLSGFDRRRWAALSDFASGLTLYYNWVLCNDVDELVAPDPATGLNLTAYLDGLFGRGLAAPVISPFAVEIVHTPATEPETIAADRPILSVRRNFRINSNYAKPCLIRRRIKFSVGGHGSNVADVRLDPQLWLFHLRYMDDAISTARLRDRQAFIAGKTGTPAGASSSTWAQGTAGFERLRAMTPEAEQAEFPEVVERMQAGRQQAASTGNWFFGPVKSRGLYRLPERFATLF